MSKKPTFDELLQEWAPFFRGLNRYLDRLEQKETPEAEAAGGPESSYRIYEPKHKVNCYTCGSTKWYLVLGSDGVAGDGSRYALFRCACGDLQELDVKETPGPGPGSRE